MSRFNDDCAPTKVLAALERHNRMGPTMIVDAAFCGGADHA